MISTINFYPGLQKTLDTLQFTHATEVQNAAIPAALRQEDLLVCAPTGSGKTLAYLLPVIHQLASQPLTPEPGALALILAPTRELARQIFKLCSTLTQSTPLHALLLTGGEEFKYQNAQLRKNPEIIIATTGRLVDLLDNNALSLSKLSILVLDEADRMLDLGFSPDVLHIAAATNPSRQTLMFSATLGKTGLDAISAALLKTPTTIDLTPKENIQPDIAHHITLADDRAHKEKILAWILKNQPFTRALVFSNTRTNADRLGGLIRYHKSAAGVLHGEKEHSIRKNLLEQFANGKLRVLVASDVAARGLDIKDVDLVINFDMPRRGDDYTHRVGRTGRAGHSGTAISLINPQEWDLMAGIQRYLKIQFEQMVIKELVGSFRGPKKLKSSGKAVGKKKKKQKSKINEKENKKTSAKKKSAPQKSSGKVLSGNETPTRKKKGLAPD